MIIDSIRNYIKQCPSLEKFNGAVRVNVNYLDDNSTTYSLEEVPSNPLIKTYLDGSSINKFDFVFCSREPYGSDVLQNIDNSGFYEEFSDWIYENNLKRIFPNLGENLEVLEIKTTSTGYAIAVDNDTGRYQISLSIKYFKKRK